MVATNFLFLSPSGILLASIVIIGTLDTKNAEVQYVRKLIEERKRRALVVDIGTLDAGAIGSGISREEVARAGGTELAALVASSKREWIMQVMAKGAERILSDLHKRGEVDGVIGVGGQQGTWIATAAMKCLPIGTPKVVVSTVASGNIRPYIAHKDIAVMFSVADMVGGLNTVTQRILENAAGAIVGMVEMTESKGGRSFPLPLERRVIGITALGTTEQAARRASDLLRTRGYESITFHASGACGSAMEELIDQGLIHGVLDLSPHELIGEIFPEDIYAPVMPGRLEAASKRGIPQVVAPGGLDLLVFGAPETIPKRYRARKMHFHNPIHTNVRTSSDDLEIIARVLAGRLNKTSGQAVVLVPLKGWTEYDKLGGELYDPEADEAFVKAVTRELKPSIRVIQVDLHMNDPSFAEKAVTLLDEMMRSSG